MDRQRAHRETSAGGVVVRCGSAGPRFLVILDGHRNWGFPKGHLIDGESPEEAARREIGEETGLHDLVNHGPLGTIDWYFRAHKRVIHKFCHFFLFVSPDGETRPQREEGITACRWLGFEDALQQVSYENAREILRAAGERGEAACREATG